MRYLLATALLVMSFSSLHAATFLERFNSLEQDIQSLQDEINVIKKSKGSSAAAARSTSDGKTTALQAELKSLTANQKKLEKTLSTLKSTKNGPISSAGAVDNTEVNSLKRAIKKLKKAQKAQETKIHELSKRPIAISANGKAVSAGMDEDEMDEIQEQFDEITKAISNIRKSTNGSHMKITADFRTSIDKINYTMADGTKTGNDDLLANRLWLNLKYKATDKISFTSQLAYYKTFGERSGTGSFAAYDNFDWITNSTANDDSVRVRKAYFFYADDSFIGTSIPWTFSVGRRPSTTGHLINLRDDDEASSPLAHSINVEFDGLSSKLDISNLVGISGMYLKLCMGRGQSNAAESLTSTPYATESGTTRPDLDMVGLIFALYNNGQYALTTQMIAAKNLIDLNSSYDGFEAVGGINGFTASFSAEGIGEEDSPFLGKWFGQFLDNTTFFMSYSVSETDPDTSMLGSTEKQRGESYWVGLQVPTLSDKGRWGVEFNTGSQYWKSITYSEDTFIGSKMATRGNAYELYWTEPFANDTMSWQLRYTYINYKYSGSNGFFGSVTGTPMTMTQAVGAGYGAQITDSASDLRFYLRYRY